jgi:dolichol-phosphate mannosyltransferase
MSQPEAVGVEGLGETPELSLVFPVRDEEGNLEALWTRTRQACRQARVSYEMLFVDDGSTDRSLERIKQLRQRDPNVRYLVFSRSFGHQAALVAGLHAARGRALIMMDADLQHPPELVPEMVRCWREGYEVVYTIKRNATIPRLWRWQMQLFYRVLSKLSGLELSFGQSDFRLLDRKVVEVLRGIPEYRKFLRGLVSWVGFRQVELAYTVPERISGRSKYSYHALAVLALDGMFAFSVTPLRGLLALGLLVSAVTLPYIGWVTCLGAWRLMGGAIDLPPGWVTVVASLLWLGSVQLIAIGIIGEYLARIFDQAKGRPAFIVRESSDREAAMPLSTGWMAREERG